MAVQQHHYMSTTAEITEQFDKMIAALPRRTEQECREWSWKYEIKPRLAKSGLPPRFWFMADKWKPAQKETYREVQSLLKGIGAIIALVGERGVGKTTIAGQLILERAIDETLEPWKRISPYRKLAEMIATFKPIYADFGTKDMESLLARHSRLCSQDNPLLVIDELHDCEDQKVKNRLLTDTLDKRYANLADTIVISNQTPEEFIETTSDSIISRIKEHGAILSCTWESWR